EHWFTLPFIVQYITPTLHRSLNHPPSLLIFNDYCTHNCIILPRSDNAALLLFYLYHYYLSILSFHGISKNLCIYNCVFMSILALITFTDSINLNVLWV